MQHQVILVAANQLQPPSQLSLPTADLSLTIIVILSTVFSNVLGWMATRAVSASDKRIDQNAAAIATQQTKLHELQTHIQNNYVDKQTYIHRLSVIDAHIEKLGDAVHEQNVLLNSIAAVLRERCEISS